ncbi:MAG: hypothetical protein FVQ79_03415 [Planctomycetes bacterium]|nr:hypothetical protein [Planctomycetota bacterium]
MILEEYLLNRGLNINPIKIEEDPVADSPALVKEVAEVWESHKTALTAVLQARINQISREILQKVRPAELLIYRQALVEVAAVIIDFEKYVGINKRTEAKEKGGSEEPPEGSKVEGEEEDTL